MLDIIAAVCNFRYTDNDKKEISTINGAFMPSPTFPIIILNARPGAGKSEIIDYLKHVPLIERKQRFHINQVDVFDDFPLLWAWFEEDDILERMGFHRLHSDTDGYFVEQHLWHVLIKRLCQQYEKRLRDDPHYHRSHTSIIEFSRGTEHGGYTQAYQHLSPEILSKAAILYINVSWEESFRKNKARYNPDKPDSILEHALDDAKITRLYREDDWLSLVDQKSAHMNINGVKVPFAVFENEDDVTTNRGPSLGYRLEVVLDRLWRRYKL
jgi:hypothetical protein